MSTKLFTAALAALLAAPALAQTSPGITTPAPAPTQPPAAAPAPAPAATAPATAPTAPAPAATAPATAPAPAPAAPAASAPAAAPAAAAPAGSQQVVVNPPAQPPAAAQPAPAQPAPAATAPSSAPSTVVVDRSERSAPLRQSNVVVDRTERSPMATVATNALYGGGAGLIVGAGIALIEQGHWGRDLAVGAGLGVVAGAIVGGVQAYNRSDLADRVALDGLGTPERDREHQRPMTSVGTLGVRW